MPDDLIVLVDVLNCGKLVRSFTAGMSREAFESDIKTRSAVLHQLLILGEAVKRLSDDFRDQHSVVPWRGYAGMRDVLIHQYDDVNLDFVWKVIDQDIPELIDYINAVIPENDSDA